MIMKRWFRNSIICCITMLLVIVPTLGAIAEDQSQQDQSNTDSVDYIPIFSEGGRVQQSEVELENEWVVSDNHMFACRIIKYTVISYGVVEATLQYGVVLEDGTILYCCNTSVDLDLSPDDDDDVLLAFGYASNITNFVYKEDESKYAFDVGIRAGYFDNITYTEIIVSILASDLEHFYNQVYSIDNVEENEEQEYETNNDNNDYVIVPDADTESTNEYDIRQFRWGDSQDKIREIEGEPMTELDTDYGYTLWYNSTCVGLDALLIFEFNQNGLCKVIYSFGEKHSNSFRYIEDYTKVKNTLISKYGSPTVYKEKWDTDDHKTYYSDNKSTRRV